MTPQTRQQIITIHVLPHISRSEGNQTIKLVESNIRNILTEKSW